MQEEVMERIPILAFYRRIANDNHFGDYSNGKETTVYTFCPNYIIRPCLSRCPGGGFQRFCWSGRGPELFQFICSNLRFRIWYSSHCGGRRPPGCGIWSALCGRDVFIW